MKRILLTLAGLLQLGLLSSRADEGMWIPSLIGKNYAQMQKLGLKLTADDIYNINKSSVKDAIVSLGFCTGEIVSAEGLFLTNHHCAYGSIQANASVEHDYLRNGFWAMSKDQELSAPGITASILQQIVDVTAKVKPELTGLDATAREAKIKELEGKLTEEFTKQGFVAQLKEMFYGNQFFIYVYEKFTDVRLVGAPPESIGKFGGDTDNWMWPRHTGDFSMMRIYANKDNKPAAYSKDNVPYKPKHFLPVSLNGIQEGDYTMILGFPGRTNRYASSYELKNALDNTSPVLINLLGKRLETMKKDMDASDEIRIKLAAKYASIANTWKYYIGQTQGLKRLNVIENKGADEAEFLKWVNADASRKAKYAQIFNRLDSAYKVNAPFAGTNVYWSVGAKGAEFVGFTTTVFAPIKAAIEKNGDVKAAVAAAQETIDKYYKDYSAITDQRVMAELLIIMNKKMPKEKQPSIIANAKGTANGGDEDMAIRKYVESMFKNSIFTSKEKLMAFLDKPGMEQLKSDPLYSYATSLPEEQKAVSNPATTAAFASFVARQKELYIAGLMEMRQGKNFYPDANSSLRLTYGKVEDYDPADAVDYDYYTTTDGILQKEDNTNDEFVVPQKLHDMITQKDFGRYADKNGKMHVAFIHTTDITGGNSGSPVINAKGELIGIAFDGNWEAMTGDLVYDAKYKRTISVDIRYVLWIVDKFAGAKNLINEMKVVQGPVAGKTAVKTGAPVKASTKL